jgi:branched-chain amino acid transport system substrate-binding protein
MKLQQKFVAIAILGTLAQAAHADINIGIVGSLTGAAAALGNDTKRAVAMMPASIGGEKVNYIMLDDATDPTTAVKSTRKMIAENKVDAIIGPNINPSAAAMLQVVDETKTPLLVTTPYFPPADKRTWVFQAVQSAGLMVQRLVEDMVENKVKTVAFVGFADSWGDLLYTELQQATQAANIKIVASERYKRPDTSVTAQVLKLVSAKPDVVFVGASGAPAALPQIELRQRGYTGKIYQSHGVTTKDFLRIGGKSVEGALIPAGPLLIAEQLPNNFASKQTGVGFNAAYEKANGADSRSTFAGSTWDAWLLLSNAIPTALKAAKPGTTEFRQALRDNLERSKDVVGVNGTYNMNANDHNGLDRRARVLIQVKDGRWTYIK